MISLFFPLFVSLSKSYSAKYDDFFMPPKVPLIPHKPNNPITFYYGIPINNNSASSCEIVGAFELRRYYSIFLR
jgi:hypothetical protein